MDIVSSDRLDNINTPYYSSCVRRTYVCMSDRRELYHQIPQHIFISSINLIQTLYNSSDNELDSLFWLRLS